jgi:ribonuclease-3
MDIGYSFKNGELLQEAMTHPSCNKRTDDGSVINYERLEFLGDSVVGLCVAELLWQRFPEESEGKLAVLHSNLVNTKCLSAIAREIDLGAHIEMDEAEAKSGGRDNARILENVLEALIGAIFLDSKSYEVVADVVERLWGSHICLSKAQKDAKTLLQEWAQKRKKPIPSYRLKSSTGSDHQPVFVFEVQVQDVGKASGEGRSRKQAETEAAQNMLELIEKEYATCE